MLVCQVNNLSNCGLPSSVLRASPKRVDKSHLRSRNWEEQAGRSKVRKRIVTDDVEAREHIE
jgi:hypothetical protein